MHTPVLYPWLLPYVKTLNRYVESDRLPSALLIVADEGFGALELVKHFAKSLYCSHTTLTAGDSKTACGECATCQMFEAQSYPDFFHVSPVADDNVIKIDVIRKLIQSLSLTTQYNAPRIVVISPAQLMTHQASNSLLKTLEEPSDNTTIILLADKVSSLSATIRSRCQLITINVHDINSSKAWLTEQGCTQSDQYLSLANGVPLVALEQWQSNILDVRNELFEQFLGLFDGKISPITFATKCIQIKERSVTGWVASWLADAAKVKQNVQQDMLLNTDLYPRLKLLPKKLHLKQIYSLLDQVMHIAQLESGQVNQQLLFEDFAINCYPK